MTRAEWSALAQRLVACWPSTDWAAAAAAGTFDVMFEDLSEFEPAQVEAAIRAYEREGNPFPPTGGMLRKRVIELAADLPDWADVWRQVESLLAVGWGGPYNGWDKAREFAAIARMHVQVAAFCETLGARQVYEDAMDQGNGRARLRNKWTEFCARQVEERNLQGLPSANLARLERVNKEPRRLGAALKALVPPEDVA